MSLRMALVAMVSEEPKSGYELTREFEGAMGEVWSARHSQIYPELGKLLNDGLIEVVEHGPRNRKTYRATAEGRREIRRWMADRQPDRTFRNEAFLKVFFLHQLTDAQRRAFLERELAFHRQDLERYEQIETEGVERLGNRLAVHLGVEYKRAMIDWTVWALEQI